MIVKILVAATALTIASAAQADSQSSDTSSNSSSNNGVVRERVIDTYCEGGYCDRYVSRRVYREDRRARRYRDYLRHRHDYRYGHDDDD